MHEPIRAKLEAYLENPGNAGHDFHEHVQTCGECSAELERMADQAMLLRGLRQPMAEPAPGFYARVMERMESNVKPGVWSTLLESAFGMRLAVVSATLALLLAGYLVSTEPGNRATSPTLTTSDGPVTAEAMPVDQSDRDRDAVLMTLASYRE